MVAIVIEAIDGVTTMMLRWRSRCQVGDDGDVGEHSNFKKIPTHTQDHGDA